MAEQANINIGVNVGEGAKSLRTLKQEFKDIQKELDNVAVGTDEYRKKLQQLGAVKDEIEDLNEAIGAQTGAGKFQALANLGSSIAGGFAAAQGAMALFGSESEDVQKALLKVQSAMALAQGLKDLEGLADGFKNAKTVIIDFGKSAISALRTLWTTMMANPILAVLAGLTALTAVVVAFMMAEDDETESLKANIAERERSIETMDKENAVVNKGMKNRIDLLRAKGATEQQVFAEEQKMNAVRIQQLAEQNNKVRENLRDLKTLRENADGDERKELTDKYNEQVKLLDKNKSEIYDIQSAAVIKQAQLDTKAKQDEEARQKAANEKAKAAFQERLDAERNALKQLNDLRIGNIDNEEQREIARLQSQFELAKKENENSKANKETKDAIQLELERKFRTDLDNLLNKFEEDRLKKEEDKKKEDEDKKKQELADAKTAEEKRIADAMTLLDIEESEKKRRGELSIEAELELETKRFDLLRENKFLDNLERQRLEEEHQTKMQEIQQKELDWEKAKQDALKYLRSNGLKDLETITTLFINNQDKAAKVQKGFALAQLAIDSANAVSTMIPASFKNAKEAAAVAGPAAPGVYAAVLAAGLASGFATIAANVAKAKAMLAKAPGGGGGVNVPSGGGGAGAPAMGQTVGNTTTNIENLQNQGTQAPQPLKAVVVQTEMANVNQQVNRIEERSKIN
jgi:hypothetical protein